MGALVDAAARELLTPLDALRTSLLRRTGRLLAPLLRDRAQRVQWWSLLAVLSAFLLTAYAPLVLLTLGPLLLGVPHLLADVRYLVVRQRFHARPALVFGVAPLLAAQCFAPSASLAFAAVALAALAARASVTARVLAAGAALLLAWLSHGHAALATLVFAHAHNGVALALWAVWARQKRQHVLPALFAFAGGSLLILHGEVDRHLLPLGALAVSPVALDVASLAAGLTPSSAPLVTLRFLLFFAFAQSVHYAVWTRLIPEEDRARAGVRSYRASYEALKADVGRAGVLVAVLLWLSFLGFALADVGLTRAGYLRLALFHGPLELCAAALLWLEGRGIRRACSHD